ncbi:MAG TPA: phage portal protein [Candidatus Acidoferrum sp.]|jgi:HK97 family phage portal protein|nr:phage portal protein [Candidatus Acidoferrum sp.]
MSSDLIVVDYANPAAALGEVLRASRAEIIETRSREVQESRSSLENPATPLSYPAEWLFDVLTGGRTDSGIRVSPVIAIQASAVFACVNLIGSTIGALDFNVMSHVEINNRRGRKVAYEHALFEFLANEPNPEMTAYTYRKTFMVHALLWGNGYAEIQRNKANRVIAIWPRNPVKTRPYRTKAGLLVFKTSEGMEEQTNLLAGDVDPNVPERTIFAEDMIHVPGLSLDGRIGQETIYLARQAVGLTLAAEKFGGSLFRNQARPSGVLTHPGKLTGLARQTLKNSWQEAQGGENANKTAVLEEGMKFETMSMKSNEAQFLETRQFQIVEVSRYFGVPPHMIGDSQHQNRANTEQIGLEFLTYGLRPWLKAQQQEYKRKLFPNVGRSANQFFPLFDTSDLTLPDADARRNFYNSGKQWGWLNTNDILEREHLNPVEDPAADKYWMPVNMQIMTANPPKPGAGQAGQDNQAGDNQDQGEPDKGKDDGGKQ